MDCHHLRNPHTREDTKSKYIFAPITTVNYNTNTISASLSQRSKPDETSQPSSKAVPQDTNPSKDKENQPVRVASSKNLEDINNMAQVT